METSISGYDAYLSKREEYKQKLQTLSKTLGSNRQQKLKVEGKKTATQELFDSLNEKEYFVSLIESGKEDEFFAIIKKKYQGGLSDEIFDNKEMRKYAKDMIGDLHGYLLEEEFRTREIDEYLEKKLKENKINKEQITGYLLSKYVRVLIENNQDVLKYYYTQYNDKIEAKKAFLNEALPHMLEEIRSPLNSFH